MTVQKTAQWMSPIHTPHAGNARFLAAFLPEFVRKKEGHDNQWQYEKGPQYPVLDHDEPPILFAWLPMQLIVVQRLRQALADFQLAASSPAPTSIVPPARLIARPWRVVLDPSGHERLFNADL